ncbi:MAG: deoxyribonuclease IV [Mycoplasmatales bacterium]|nr:deoxyribonuclease IV [Mycoplasmatales bacterium]
MKKIGSHISFKAPNYLVGAIEESLKNKATALMIYLGAPQSSRRVDKEKYKLDEYIEKYKNIIVPEDIVVHAPYITNPANPEKQEFTIDFLVQEIERMNYIGAKHLVLHPGAHTKFERSHAIETLIDSLNKIFERTSNVEISIETMAGKGTEIGKTLKELKYIVEKVKNPRLNICLDTCHIWDAGYDIKKLDEFIDELKKYDLKKLIKVIHVNDSKNPIGAAKDRHENIGKGFIGLDPLKKIVNSKEFEDAIMILETPWVNGTPIYDKEIEMLK